LASEPFKTVASKFLRDICSSSNDEFGLALRSFYRFTPTCFGEEVPERRQPAIKRVLEHWRASGIRTWINHPQTRPAAGCYRSHNSRGNAAGGTCSDVSHQR
jgi:hypothetical protein